jgi:hypothetical protein
MGVNGFLRKSFGDMWAAIGPATARQQSAASRCIEAEVRFSILYQMDTGSTDIRDRKPTHRT